MIGHVERGNVRIAFEVTGSGPDLVLGHSFLCDRSMWRHQVPTLARRFRVVNIDGRGHGDSSRVQAPCTMTDLVEDALAVADHLGIDRAVWAGLSMGGMVAMRLALMAPGRVSALMLLDTDGGAESAWRRFKYGALARVVRLVGVGPVLGQIRKQMFGPTFRRARRDLVHDWTAGLLDRIDIPSMVEINEALRNRDDVTPALPDVPVPALVLVGTEDLATPPARAWRLAGALPNARLVEIPAAGHLSAVERPAEVTAAMVEFLDAATPRN